MALEGIAIETGKLIVGIIVMAIGLILAVISKSFESPVSLACLILGLIAFVIGFIILMLAFI